MFRVPDGKREHPDQRLRHVIALGLVEVGENLGVATGREDVTVPLEPTSNRLVVVELAVLRSDDGATFVRERLVTVDEVDDAQPPHANGYSIRDVIASVIRTSMPHRRRHRAQRCKVDSGARFTADLHDSTNPAHGACTVAGARRRGDTPVDGIHPRAPDRLASPSRRHPRQRRRRRPTSGSRGTPAFHIAADEGEPTGGAPATPSPACRSGGDSRARIPTWN